MHPYHPQPVFHLGPLSWHPFAVLVMSAFVVGFWIFVPRGERLGLDRRVASGLYAVTITAGFVGAHIFKVAVPNIRLVIDSPEILLRTGGIASFGGIIGGTAAAAIWLKIRRVPWRGIVQWLDLFAFVFPFSFVFGRLGCTLAHDHRGRFNTGWLSFAYPEGPRYNLGFIEFLFLTALSILFLALDRRKRRAGFYLGLWGLLYGLFRLWLDTLHSDAPRILGVTPDQLGAGIALLLGVAGLITMRKS